MHIEKKNRSYLRITGRSKTEKAIETDKNVDYTAAKYSNGKCDEMKLTDVKDPLLTSF